MDVHKVEESVQRRLLEYPVIKAELQSTIQENRQLREKLDNLKKHSELASIQLDKEKLIKFLKSEMNDAPSHYTSGIKWIACMVEKGAFDIKLTHTE